MRIKATLKTLITLMFILSLLPAVAPAKKTKWNFAIQGQRRAFTEGLEAAKVMMEKIDPDFELNIVYGNALSPAKQNLDGLKIGAFESAFMFAAYHPGKLPMTMVLELPFLLPTESYEEKQGGDRNQEAPHYPGRVAQSLERHVLPQCLPAAL